MYLFFKLTIGILLNKKVNKNAKKQHVHMILLICIISNTIIKLNK